MIVRCPACEARFRLDRQRLAGKRLTLKCRRCAEVFKVAVPRGGASLRVLVAHGDQELCRTVGEILDRDGISYATVHDGADALRRLDAESPQVVLADVALPGLYAFQLVERIRERPASRQPRVILLSSVYSRTAYKRAPSSLYGADDYLEKHHVADQLIPKILRLAQAAGIQPPLADGDQAPAQPPTLEDADPYVNEVNRRILGAEEREVGPPPQNRILEKARRLARIIASDIALYNQELVDQGIREGTFFTLLASEVEEGRRLFQDRFGAESGIDIDLLQQAFEELIANRRRELTGAPTGEGV